MNSATLLPGIDASSTLLFVHAHPDDETIVTGGTMAAAVAAGARVVLVTSTRGELGEVIPPELAHLEVKVDAGRVPESAAELGAGLAQERERELAGALAALGVTEHIWLGQGPSAPADGERTFRDSGMKWGSDGRATAADTVLPGSFSKVPLQITGELLAQVIRAVRPTAVVTYAADGGYGHPDHVRTHQMTVAALRLATHPGGGHPAWHPQALYYIISDRPERPLEPDVPRIAVAGDRGAKTAAMEAHRTQITVRGEEFSLSDNVWREIKAVEEFVRADPASVYHDEELPA